MKDAHGRAGVLHATIVAEHPEQIRYSADTAFWTDADGRRLRPWHR